MPVNEPEPVVWSAPEQPESIDRIDEAGGRAGKASVSGGPPCPPTGGTAGGAEMIGRQFGRPGVIPGFLRRESPTGKAGVQADATWTEPNGSWDWRRKWWCGNTHANLGTLVTSDNKDF